MARPAKTELFDYWNALRDGRIAPNREDIEPGAIRGCLADTFVLAIDVDHGHPFRLAGTSICALFGRELKGSAFADLWTPPSGPRLTDMLRTITENTAGVVAAATGANHEGDTLNLELTLLPLAGGGGELTRLLGGITPMTTPYWMGARPLDTLRLAGWRIMVERSTLQRRTSSSRDRMAGGAVAGPLAGWSNPAISRNRQG